MKLSIRELCVFSMLGALMVATKALMDALPNIHLLAPLIAAYTLVYRKKALYPLYVFVLLEGLLNGFGTWWIPYLYIWTLLWGAVMLLPEKLPQKLAPLIYMAVCALHGFLFGTLYAPVQALLYGLSFKATLTWIAAGIPFDLIHGVSNFFCGALVLPITAALRRVERPGMQTMPSQISQQQIKEKDNDNHSRQTDDPHSIG